jgi:hypothetical protein
MGPEVNDKNGDAVEVDDKMLRDANWKRGV